MFFILLSKWLLNILGANSHSRDKREITSEDKKQHAKCEKGHLFLEDTYKCHGKGYTCSIGDNNDCCKGKNVESRKCIPCDETRHKKPDDSEYTESGNCEYMSSNGITIHERKNII